MIVDIGGQSRAARVMHDTWGHLRTPDAQTFAVTVLFTVTAWGESALIQALLPDDLPDSPWLFEAINDMVTAYEGAHPDAVGVFRFTGTYATGAGLVGAVTDVRVE